MSNPKYRCETDALLAFLKDHWATIHMDFDNPNDLMEAFEDELRHANNGLVYLNYQQE